MTHSLSDMINRNYKARNDAVRDNLLKLVNCGVCKDKNVVIMAVDQGFEHGPHKSFSSNPAAYDPSYHLKLAIECGLSAIAAPLGFMEVLYNDTEEYKKLPKILKLNSNCSAIYPNKREHVQALLSTPQDAERLGCIGVGITIYPGTSSNTKMMEYASRMIAEARGLGLFSVVWSYPRGDGVLGKEQSVDNVSHAVQIACHLGADIVKVKVPKAEFRLLDLEKYITRIRVKFHEYNVDERCRIVADNVISAIKEKHIECKNRDELKKFPGKAIGKITAIIAHFPDSFCKQVIEIIHSIEVEEEFLPYDADAIKKVMQAAFDSKRIVIFSGGEIKEESSVIHDVKAIIAGGGNGSIIGRNIFQRPRDEAVELLKQITDLYSAEEKHNESSECDEK
ncbi:beta/alpha barrel domain-containing protein [Candidatus Fokinia crypta]|uniref:fructose-bisphosphate aldolase n=1 Tax=Candidatus Fokinia crypta TaxID=1920990 RepID=A0ABZ0USH4_9RICK|nr:hypothetical protein [Candidatus Fokinia cryptica]WPX97860.1 Fructose-bisphosphate aldolase class 1 [Candidatus Fokinia cryptica]